MIDQLYSVLTLRTDVSTRSIIGEATPGTNYASRVCACLVGGKPKGVVNALAIKGQKTLGILMDNFLSKNWDGFFVTSPLKVDSILAVGDEKTREACPIWGKYPTRVFWKHEDFPSVEESKTERHGAFAQVGSFPRNRIAVFPNLSHATIDRTALQKHLKEIGTMNGSTRVNVEKH